MNATRLPEDLPADLSTTQVAQLLDVKRSTVVQWIAEERMPAVRNGARWVISANDLRDFVATWRRPQAAGRQRRDSGYRVIWDALAALDEFGQCDTFQVAAAIDRHPGNVRKYLLILRRRGFVESSMTGVYRITPAGRRHLREEMSVAS